MLLKNLYTLLFVINLVVLVLSISSCKKFVEVPPPDTSITDETAYNSDVTAIAVLNSLYTRLSNEFGLNTFSSISTFAAGLSSDEFSLWSGATNVNHLGYYRNELSPALNTGKEVWFSGYAYLYTCNAAIEGIMKSSKLTANVKNQLSGEAKFMRAFFNFYLVNLYGEIPLMLSTDYNANSGITRTAIPEVYLQILKDLKDAEGLLSENYLDASLRKEAVERVRPTKYAAYAMLARVYLYLADYDNAIKYASLVINNTNSFSLVPLEEAFLKNNKEAIWQLQPTVLGYNTQQGRLLALTSSGVNTTRPIYLSNSLVNTFEQGDGRRKNWVDSVRVSSKVYHYSDKYKIGVKNNDINTIASLTEYFMILRLSEILLIRTEAFAMKEQFNEALADINIIRDRARVAPTTDMPDPLPPISSISDKNEMVKLILKERQVELFSEWGHRWLDIKRLNFADSIMTIESSKKGGVWKPYKALFPIPQSEINANPKLTQNKDY